MPPLPVCVASITQTFRTAFPSFVNAFAQEAPVRAGVGLEAASLTVVDDDFAEMGTAFEVAVCFDCPVEGENLIDHRPQLVQRQSPVHRFEIGSAADADRTERH